MHCKSGRFYIYRISCQSAHHHNPSYSTLKGSEKKEGKKRNLHFFFNVFSGKQVNKPHHKYYPYQPCPEAVEPFPEKNKLKIFQRKPGVQQLILRCLLILFKFRIPVGFIHRRYNTGNNIPFGNGKARTCKPGDATQ